jgi:hypothetical protein
MVGTRLLASCGAGEAHLYKRRSCTRTTRHFSNHLKNTPSDKLLIYSKKNKCFWNRYDTYVQSKLSPTMATPRWLQLCTALSSSTNKLSGPYNMCKTIPAPANKLTLHCAAMGASGKAVHRHSIKPQWKCYSIRDINTHLHCLCVLWYVIQK